MAVAAGAVRLPVVHSAPVSALLVALVAVAVAVAVQVLAVAQERSKPLCLCGCAEKTAEKMV